MPYSLGSELSWPSDDEYTVLADGCNHQDLKRRQGWISIQDFAPTESLGLQKNELESAFISRGNPQSKACKYRERILALAGTLVAVHPYTRRRPANRSNAGSSWSSQRNGSVPEEDHFAFGHLTYGYSSATEDPDNENAEEVKPGPNTQPPVGTTENFMTRSLTLDVARCAEKLDKKPLDNDGRQSRDSATDSAGNFIERLSAPGRPAGNLWPSLSENSPEIQESVARVSGSFKETVNTPDKEADMVSVITISSSDDYIDQEVDAIFENLEVDDLIPPQLTITPQEKATNIDEIEEPRIAEDGKRDPTASAPPKVPQDATSEIPAPFLRQSYHPLLSLVPSAHALSSLFTPENRIMTCFRVAEALRQINQAQTQSPCTIELFANVLESKRITKSLNDGAVVITQVFQFADLFFPNRPPFLIGEHSSWHECTLYEEDTSIFLRGIGEERQEKEEGKLQAAGEGRMQGQSSRMCRAIIRTRSDGMSASNQFLRHGWKSVIPPSTIVVDVLNIYESEWEEVQLVRQIVDPPNAVGMGI